MSTSSTNIYKQFPLVTQIVSQLIGTDLVPVQPMELPQPIIPVSNSFGQLSHPEYEDDDGFIRIFIKSDIGFISICNTILYSKNEEHIAYAYNELFTTYRAYLKWGASGTSKSCFEEVVYKILNDCIKTDAFELHGEKFAPFTKLIALAREATTVPKYSTLNFFAGQNKKDNKPKCTYFDLNKCVLYYIKEHDDEIKDEQLKFFLKKNFTNFNN